MNRFLDSARLIRFATIALHAGLAAGFCQPRGKILMQQQFDQAEAAFKKAAELNPKFRSGQMVFLTHCPNAIFIAKTGS